MGAMTAADPGAPERAQTTALASSGIFEDEPRHAPHVVASAVPSVPASIAAAHAHPAPKKSGSSGIVVLFGGLAAVAAIAAGAFFVYHAARASRRGPNLSTTKPDSDCVMHETTKKIVIRNPSSV